MSKHDELIAALLTIAASVMNAGRPSTSRPTGIFDRYEGFLQQILERRIELEDITREMNDPPTK